MFAYLFGIAKIMIQPIQANFILLLVFWCIQCVVRHLKIGGTLVTVLVHFIAASQY